MATLSKTRDEEKRGRLKLHPPRNAPERSRAEKQQLLARMQEMMQKMFELQKVSFEQSIQEVKEQISGALDSLVADVDDLKERTKATEEATVNRTFKNGEHRAAIDTLEKGMEEMTQRLDDKTDKLESFSKRDNLIYIYYGWLGLLQFVPMSARHEGTKPYIIIDYRGEFVDGKHLVLIWPKTLERSISMPY